MERKDSIKIMGETNSGLMSQAHENMKQMSSFVVRRISGERTGGFEADFPIRTN